MNIGKNFIVFTLASLLLTLELRDIPNIRQSSCIGLAQSTPRPHVHYLDIVKQSNRPKYSRKPAYLHMSPCSDVSSYQCL